MTALARLLVRTYQLLVSPLLGSRCKYHPTCSAYALQALEEFGFLRGSVLSAWRLMRCNPWSHGGVDYPSQQTLFRAAPARRAGSSASS